MHPSWHPALRPNSLADEAKISVILQQDVTNEVQPEAIASEAVQSLSPADGQEPEPPRPLPTHEYTSSSGTQVLPKDEISDQALRDEQVLPEPVTLEGEQLTNGNLNTNAASATATDEVESQSPMPPPKQSFYFPAVEEETPEPSIPRQNASQAEMIIQHVEHEAELDTMAWPESGDNPFERIANQEAQDLNTKAPLMSLEEYANPLAAESASSFTEGLSLLPQEEAQEEDISRETNPQSSEPTVYEPPSEQLDAEPDARRPDLERKTTAQVLQSVGGLKNDVSAEGETPADLHQPSLIESKIDTTQLNRDSGTTKNVNDENDDFFNGPGTGKGIDSDATRTNGSWDTKGVTETVPALDISNRSRFSESLDEKWSTDGTGVGDDFFGRQETAAFPVTEPEGQKPIDSFGVTNTSLHDDSVADRPFFADEEPDAESFLLKPVADSTGDSNVVAAEVGQEKETDLAATWGDIFDDEDFLAEPSNDMSFLDDDEGFLQDETDANLPSAPSTQTAPKTSAYVPQTSTGSSLAQNPGYQNFTDNNIVSNSIYSMQQPAMPAIVANRAESFVDKAKGGYASPYDLPTELAPRTRSRAAAPAPSSLGKVPAPPPGLNQQDSRPPSSSNNAAPQASAAKPAAPSAFFEELPSVPRPRSVRPPSSVPLGSQTNPPPPPRSDSTQYTPVSSTTPPNNIPRANSTYVPNVPTPANIPDTNQSQASDSATSVPSSRYSPAQNYAPQIQHNKPAPPFAAPPPRPSSTSAAQAFLPRTSSPLAQNTPLKAQPNPLPALIETPREQSFEPVPSRPPPRGSSTVYALPTQNLTSNRDAAVQSMRSVPALQKTSLQPVSKPIVPERVFMPPNNGMERDTFQRWMGAPILKFGFDGKALSFKPREEPRYAAGQMQPSYLRTCGDVKILASSSVLSGNDLASFPGPLKSKGKKKELLTWIKAHVSTMQQGTQIGAMDSSDSNDSESRTRERLLLWRLVAHLVEHDGVLQGTPPTDASLSAIFDGSGSAEPSAQQNAIIARPDQASSDVQRDVVGTMNAMMTALLHGEREKAMWAAVDQKMWGHALLLAGTLSKDIWKQVCHEFVQTEVKSAGENTEIFAAFYNILSGNGAESVDQLVPPSARAGMQLMSVNSSSGSTRDPRVGLAKWTDLLRLILKNRTGDDASALTSLGQLLLNYGRVEAAHICFICALNPTMLGSLDNPQSSVVLLGANGRTQPGSLLETDNILLTEAFEFAMTTLRSSQPYPALHYLQAFKIQHAMSLIELGEKSQAQQYCDAIGGAMKGGTRVSTYYHPIVFSALEDLATRITQADKDTSNKSWIGRPAMGNVSGTVWNRFTSFVAGEDDAADDKSAPASESEFGPFATVNGETPSISRSTSPMMQYGSASGPYAPQMHKSSSFLTPSHSQSLQAPNITSPSNLPYAPMSTKSTYTASIKSNPLPSRSSSQYAPVRKPYAPYQPLQSEGVTVTPPEPAGNLDARPQTPLTGGSSPVNNRSAFSSPQRSAQPPATQYQPYRPLESNGNGPIGGNPNYSYTPSVAHADQSYSPQSVSVQGESQAPRGFDSGYQPLVSSNGEEVPEQPSTSSQHDQGYVPAERPPDAAEIIVDSVTPAYDPEGGADMYDFSKAASPSYMNGGSLAPPPFQPFEVTTPESIEEHGVKATQEAADDAPQQSIYSAYGNYTPFAQDGSSTFIAGGDVPSTAEDGSYSGYEPPSYSYSSGYDPGIPEQPAPEPDADNSDEDKNAPKKKKKSFMDLSDDEEAGATPISSARLRPSATSGFTPTAPSFLSPAETDDRAARDRAAQEAFMRAAEADAARDNANKSAKPASGGGIGSYLSFGGLWGSKKASPDPSKDASAKADANTPAKAIKAKLGEENSFYFDPQLKKWVNKKAGAEDARPSAPTPPPPRSGPPSRAVSAAATPSQSMPGLGIAPTSTPGPDNDLPPVPSIPPTFASVTPPPGSGPPTRPGTGLGMGTPPPGGAVPPKKKNDLDDLLAGGTSGRGTVKKSKKGGSRYLDVMAK